jgi:hypothetical protein
MTPIFRSASFLLLTISACLYANADSAQAIEAPRVLFTRMIAHWDAYGDPDYLKFVDEARPELAQVGFYGGHYWSLSHTAQFAGYPSHFPVRGLTECGDWFTELNRQLHARKVKVVGHFNIKFLVGDPDGPDGPRGFFKFYRDLWEECELGPKPVADAKDLLEIDAEGAPIVNNSYKIGGMKEYWGCLLNPHWRTVLKAWAKRGIERGVDGYMINYFYRHNCLCEHCRHAFRDYMSERFTKEQLQKQFSISDIKTHVFPEIVAWHSPAESTPLRREMLRFSQIANKRAYDDVFVDYARKLKPGLILGQWNHLGDFNQVSGDERCLLPAEMWARGEDYAWYSTGDSACYTDLANGWLGEGTLQARYLSGALGGRPFTLGKYESTRTRVAISELAANGGVPMGFYTRFKSPEARAEITRYYRFIEQHDAVFRGALPHAESLLIYPRSSVHEGKMDALLNFKNLGHKLLDAHHLFAILPDDVTVPDHLKAARIMNDAAADGKASRFDAPSTVRISASVPATGGKVHFHFVNYNRTEPEKPKSPGRGIEDEKPIMTKAIACDVPLPKEFKKPQVTVFTPESPVPTPITSKLENGRLHFEVPAFLVYSVVEVRD